MLLVAPSGRLLFTVVIALHALSGCAGSPSAKAQDVAPEQHQFSAERTIGADDIDAAVAAASRRSGLPENWIRAVMRAESAGNRRAVSSKGAMGLMQIMPGTWAELRAQYSLGDDPFDVRDNVLAGAMYLRAMYDRFGAPGFLAAYNAGPGRYAEHLRTGRPLARETRAYVAQLAPRIGAPTTANVQTARASVPSDWWEAPLFATRAERVPIDREAAPDAQSVTQATDIQGADNLPANTLFVSVQRRPER
ncbi:lytic transglycosylase domain-containing protein [Sulfitobacter sp. D35]|uniref:lytic transglycosylase domain-containing protein n=1 Tax=Sulfitobacter sp. D35 TaxID=3083252 RepID=UPI00296EA932|nr:lytic transglycosylase domain-containing protein [Sulfitobacter sp. D35]MDW4497904.1 lytic transglycosylase domain-containing protein [Sulfitobacter sp. D35]